MAIVEDALFRAQTALQAILWYAPHVRVDYNCRIKPVSHALIIVQYAQMENVVFVCQVIIQIQMETV